MEKPINTQDNNISNSIIKLPYKIDKEYFFEPISIQKKHFYNIFKRLFDISFSIIMIIFCLLPMMIIGILVKTTSKGSALFVQSRLGLNGKKFLIIKFRTMIIDAEKHGAQWSDGDDDPRITKIGAFLRKTRLDELPQLWCILFGTMSFVGPRPEREVFYEAFETYIHGFNERLKVKPGLTGYAQVNGGYYLKPEEKIVYDLEYIKCRSLWLDFKIFLKTVGVVFKGSGAK